MHTIVPIIMAFGFIVFFVGLAIYIRLGYQGVKSLNFRGKEYKLGRFTLALFGLGSLLVMGSILIQKSIPDMAEPDSQLIVSSPVKSDFELELMLSDAESDALVAYVQKFQEEYQSAIERNDDSTIGLLRLELAFRLRAEFEEQGYEASRLEQEVQRIMARLPQ